MAQKTPNASSFALLGADDRPICDYEGILEIVKAHTSQVLNEPIENGQLAAFNKVQQPDSVKVTLSLGYDPATQTASMGKLKRLKHGTGTAFLCRLVSPADVVENLALETIGTTHSASRGATLLIVELGFLQVRAVSVSASSAAWTPKSASSAQPVNRGRVQPRQSSIVKLSESVK